MEITEIRLRYRIRKMIDMLKTFESDEYKGVVNELESMLKEDFK